MIELYLYVKSCLNFFSRKPELSWTREANASYIFSSTAKRWFNRTHLPLFQNMSVNIYYNFSLSSGGSKFKINDLNDIMRYGMWVNILLNNLALPL